MAERTLTHCRGAGLGYTNSAEYQGILHLRVNSAISDLILVDGVGPDFTVAGFVRQVRAAIRERRQS